MCVFFWCITVLLLICYNSLLGSRSGKGSGKWKREGKERKGKDKGKEREKWEGKLEGKLCRMKAGIEGWIKAEITVNGEGAADGENNGKEAEVEVDREGGLLKKCRNNHFSSYQKISQYSLPWNQSVTVEHCKKSMKGGTSGTYVSGAWGKCWEEMMEGERMGGGGGTVNCRVWY